MVARDRREATVKVKNKIMSAILLFIRITKQYSSVWCFDCLKFGKVYIASNKLSGCLFRSKRIVYTGKFPVKYFVQN